VVLVECDTLLRVAIGDFVDGLVGLYFVCFVVLRIVGDLCAVLAVVDFMVAVAICELDNGWLSCAFSLWVDLWVDFGEREVVEYDLENVLRDLVDVENVLWVGC